MVGTDRIHPWGPPPCSIGLGELLLNPRYIAQKHPGALVLIGPEIAPHVSPKEVSVRVDHSHLTILIPAPPIDLGNLRSDMLGALLAENGMSGELEEAGSFEEPTRLEWEYIVGGNMLTVQGVIQIRLPLADLRFDSLGAAKRVAKISNHILFPPPLHIMVVPTLAPGVAQVATLMDDPDSLEISLDHVQLLLAPELARLVSPDALLSRWHEGQVHVTVPTRQVPEGDYDSAMAPFGGRELFSNSEFYSNAVVPVVSGVRSLGVEPRLLWASSGGTGVERPEWTVVVPPSTPALPRTQGGTTTAGSWLVMAGQRVMAVVTPRAEE